MDLQETHTSLTLDAAGAAKEAKGSIDSAQPHSSFCHAATKELQADFKASLPCDVRNLEEGQVNATALVSLELRFELQHNGPYWYRDGRYISPTIRFNDSIPMYFVLI